MKKIALVVLTLVAFALPCGTARAVEGAGVMRAASHGGADAGGDVFEAAIARFDWHPRAGGLLLSVGAVIDDIRVAAMAHPPAPGRNALGDAWVQARMPSRRELAAYLGIGYRATTSGFYGQAGLAAGTGLDGEPRRAGEQAVYPVLELGWSYRF
ncbi:MAG: hypothetical protein ABS82_13870 [Rhodanobacter sp. SCN 67-45]|jgi:hypothetical protein|nr:MAG: hypothetical protein ABS82_13870 [Rhodanobacter sp. SCN 67-45]